MSDENEIITDRFLGRFRKTGQRRVPDKGEYYLCDHVAGIGRSIGDSRNPKQILERMDEAGAVKLPIRRGGI